MGQVGAFRGAAQQGHLVAERLGTEAEPGGGAGTAHSERMSYMGTREGAHSMQHAAASVCWAAHSRSPQQPGEGLHV